MQLPCMLICYIDFHSTCSGDSDLTYREGGGGGASREQHDYCCMTVEFQGGLGVQPQEAIGFLQFEGLKTA